MKKLFLVFFLFACPAVAQQSLVTSINGKRGDVVLPQLPSTAGPQVCKTAAYTMATSDYVVCVNTSAAAISITLPACAAGLFNQDYTIKRYDGGMANALNIGNSTDTIDGTSGTSAVTSTSAWDSVRLHCQFTNAWVRLR